MAFSFFSKNSTDARTELVLAIHRGNSLAGKVKEELKDLEVAENLSRTTGYPTPVLNIVASTNKLLADWQVLTDDILDKIGDADRKELAKAVDDIKKFCQQLEDTPIMLITLIHKGNGLCFRIKSEQAKVNLEAQKLRDKGFFITAAEIGKPFVVLIEGWTLLRDRIIGMSDTMDRIQVCDATEEVRSYCATLSSAPSAANLVAGANTSAESALRDEVTTARTQLLDYGSQLNALAEQLTGSDDTIQIREFLSVAEKRDDPSRIASYVVLERYRDRVNRLCARAEELLNAKLRTESAS